MSSSTQFHEKHQLTLAIYCWMNTACTRLEWQYIDSLIQRTLTTPTVSMYVTPLML